MCSLKSYAGSRTARVCPEAHVQQTEAEYRKHFESEKVSEWELLKANVEILDKDIFPSF